MADIPVTFLQQLPQHTLQFLPEQLVLALPQLTAMPLLQDEKRLKRCSLSSFSVVSSCGVAVSPDGSAAAVDARSARNKAMGCIVACGVKRLYQVFVREVSMRTVDWCLGRCRGDDEKIVAGNAVFQCSLRRLV